MEHLGLSLAGSELGSNRHLCALFNSDEEEYSVLLPFIKDGIACGHKAIHIVNREQGDDHRRRLAAAGIDTRAAEVSGQLEVLASSDTYLRHGAFDPDRMVEMFQQMASGAATQSFRPSRIVCRMDWAAVNRMTVEQLIEFESRVNDVWSRHEDTVVCSYHLSQFSGDEVIDIMRTHPLVIVGGVLRRNPFYLPPQTFLPELRARRARSQTPTIGL